MLKRKELMYLALFTIVGLVVAFLISHKDWVIKECLANPPPTLFSLDKREKDTESKLESLEKEFRDFKDKAAAQSASAAAAQAQLQAIH